MRRGLAAAAMLLAAACGAQDAVVAQETEAPEAERHTSWRRVRVAAAEASGRVHLYDAEDELVTDVVDAPAGALLATASGQHAVILPASGAPALALWSGVSIIDHDDHIHVYKFPAELRPFPLGERRSVAVASAASDVLFVDEAGAVLHLNEDAVVKDGAAALRITWAAQARRAVPLAGEVVVIGEDGVLHRGGEALEGAPCVGAGAVATAPGRAVVACGDGLLSLVAGEKPGRLGAPAGIETLALGAGEAGPVVALTGEGALHVASEVGAPFRVLAPRGWCRVAVDPGAPQRLVGLTEAGEVRVLDAAEGRVLLTVPVAPAAACGAAEGALLAVAPDRAYVASPGRPALLEVDTETGATVEHALAGAPVALTVLGVDVRNANVAPGAEH